MLAISLELVAPSRVRSILAARDLAAYESKVPLFFQLLRHSTRSSKEPKRRNDLQALRVRPPPHACGSLRCPPRFPWASQKKRASRPPTFLRAGAPLCCDRQPKLAGLRSDRVEEAVSNLALNKTVPRS